MELRQRQPELRACKAFASPSSLAFTAAARRSLRLAARSAARSFSTASSASTEACRQSCERSCSSQPPSSCAAVARRYFQGNARLPHAVFSAMQARPLHQRYGLQPLASLPTLPHGTGATLTEEATWQRSSSTHNSEPGCAPPKRRSTRCRVDSLCTP